MRADQKFGARNFPSHAVAVLRKGERERERETEREIEMNNRICKLIADSHLNIPLVFFWDIPHCSVSGN